MTQENKELLLKDICARLPYGVKALNKEEIITIRAFIPDLVIDEVGISHAVEDCKPYLFPLSSMTEEQKREYDSIIYREVELHCERYYDVIDVDCFEELQEFYHKNHLDYRNLIGFGVANDATGLNIY